MRYNDMVKAGLIAGVLAVLALVVGCQGHKADGLDNVIEAPDAAAIGQSNEGRLEPAPGGAPAALALSGTITLNGFTILDDQLKPTTGGLDFTKITAQLIDEEDDILLAEVKPGSNGKYTLSIFTPLINLKLRVFATVQEDIDGDGTGNDKLTLEAPVKLQSGKTVRVDLRLKRAAQTDMQPVLWPTKGAAVLCDLYKLDANGSLTSYYGLFVSGGFVIISRDGDRLLEDGDDLRQPDLDHNGWPDTSEAAYGSTALDPSVLSGIVINVDLVNQTLIVRNANNINTVVFVSFFCGIEAYTQQAGFYGSIPLSTELIGKAVTITGQVGPGGMFADWITYTP